MTFLRIMFLRLMRLWWRYRVSVTGGAYDDTIAAWEAHEAKVRAMWDDLGPWDRADFETYRRQIEDARRLIHSMRVKANGRPR